MRYVIEVSRWKSINKASKNLYVNQQQLSRIIASVESQLGVAIFSRNPKGAFLTQEGETVVKKFEEILAIYDSIAYHDEPQESIKGKLKILAELNIWTSYVRLYKGFVKMYPDVNLTIRNMATQEIIEYLTEYEAVSMISRIINNDQTEEYTIPPVLEFLPVARDHLMVYGAVNNPYIKKYKTISLATLQELPLINFKPYNNYPSLLERVFADIGVPDFKYEVNDIKVFWELVAESDCLFLCFRRPKYTSEESIGEIPLRDKLFFENGILKRKNSQSELVDIFAQYYLDYYGKLY